MKPTTLNTAVRRALAGLGLPGPGDTLLAAVSGGADSVALLDALVSLQERLGFRVVAAHLDHALRAGSREDAEFCAALCERLGVRLVRDVADVRARAARERGGLEEAARRERYAFLRHAKAEVGALAIAVAHTRDDQAETLLLRLLRGAGSDGLAGMRPRSGDVIRPLLAVARSEVLAHLAARRLEWREDPSNSDPAFARNRVRHELIPYLERRFNPRLREALARTAELLAAEAELLAAHAPQPRPFGDGSAVVRLDELGERPLAARRMWVRSALAAAGGLRGVRQEHVERILRLAARPSGSGRSLALPGGREASVSFGSLRIGPRRPGTAAFALPLAVPGRVALPVGGTLVAERVRGALADAPAEAAKQPILVRTRRPGDRVRVHGRLRSLKRYLIAARVPASERGRLPLVARGDEVLWLPGLPLQPADAVGVRFHLEPA